jgi:hypothetical protein
MRLPDRISGDLDVLGIAFERGDGVGFPRFAQNEPLRVEQFRENAGSRR